MDEKWDWQFIQRAAELRPSRQGAPLPRYGIELIVHHYGCLMVDGKLDHDIVIAKVAEIVRVSRNKVEFVITEYMSSGKIPEVRYPPIFALN